MATKLKKRRPGVTFLFFALSLSVLMVCAVAAVVLWNPWSMATDFKNTEQYHETTSRLLYEATRTAMDLPPEAAHEAEARAAAENDEYAVTFEGDTYTATLKSGESYTVLVAEGEPTLAQESTNVSYFLQGRGGIMSHGEEAKTQAEFEAAVRGKSNLDGSLPYFDVSNQGQYAHLIILDKSGVKEWKSTRFGFSVKSSTLARSNYVWIFPTDMRQMLSLPENESLVVCLAVRSEVSLENVGSVYSVYYDWYRQMGTYLIVLVVGAAALLILLITLLKFRSLSLANHAIARLLGRFWLEVKVLLTLVAVYIGIVALIQGMYYDVVYFLAFLPFFWWCWCILLDICINKKAFFKNNSVAAARRFYHTLESKYPFLERMKKRAGLLLAAEAVLVILAALMVAFAEPMVIRTLPVFLCVGLVLVGLALLFLFIRSYNREMDEFGLIVDYAHKIRAGGADTALAVKQGSALSALTDDLNEIHSGINSAVEERVRSEKMKAELVTNVSHDLKTPLTSIINYIGLLDKEELSPAFTNEYVDILAQKSQRLKNLVQDLFEVSKANSGAVEMKPEQLDVVSLIEQTIAELDERTQRAGVEIKTQFASQRVCAVADGRQIHRVFENLLGNALKYSLSGTRVYVSVDMAEGEGGTQGGAEITFKNIAGYEMNFTAEDIVERFQRGDASRTTEGSGLGLAIARSFVELNRGTLKIELDGDLFKATVRLPSVLEQAQAAKPAQPVEASAPAEAAQGPQTAPEPDPAAEQAVELLAHEPPPTVTAEAPVMEKGLEAVPQEIHPMPSTTEQDFSLHEVLTEEAPANAEGVLAEQGPAEEEKPKEPVVQAAEAAQE